MNRRLRIFDLDHTLISENSSYRFSQFLFRRNVLSVFSFLKASWYYFRHLFFNLSLNNLHRKVFNHSLKGLSLDILKIHIEPFLQEFLAHHLYMPAVSELRLAQQLGEHTAIFSSSPDFLVKLIAKYFQVDYWEATSYIVDKESIFTTISHILDGPQKAESLIKLVNNLKIDKSQVIAYSDSYTDLPFLLEAGSSVVVSPDKKLKAYAQAHKWKII